MNILAFAGLIFLFLVPTVPSLGIAALLVWLAVRSKK